MTESDRDADDVARYVGVSARTVSRVVNDEGGCTLATRDRILDAIAELGYRPNLMARGLIRRRSDTIGLVAAELLDPFFPEFADGVQAAEASIGRTIFLVSTDSDRAPPASCAHVVARARRRRGHRLPGP